MSNSQGTTADVNWIYEDYFEHLLKTNGEEFGYALELMVDDLHKKKEKTVNRFMCHQNVDALLFALLRLLNNDNLRVAGNTAYILGCLAESQLGCYRLLSTVTSNKNFRVLHSLVKMLTVSDGETVMNAAGTIGTMAESKEGREWILGEDCIHDLIDFCSGLLASDNLWTGSNAALVLARLSISDQGCAKLSGHADSVALLRRLCGALGCDDAGRGMNAAFALGRLADAPAGADLLGQQGAPDLARLVRDLAGMTGGRDPGSAKNACFCLSCLAGSEFGHGLLLEDADLAARLLAGLVSLLTGADEETAWFAALAIRIISSKPKGARFLKGQQQAVATLKSVLDNPDVSPDLKEEVASALDFLRPLEKPFPPMVEVRGCSELGVRWLAAETKCGFPVTYDLHCNHGQVYSGPDNSFVLTRLDPATAYALRVRVCTEADKSTFSETIVATTEEAAPSKPSNLRLLAATATQLKVGWDPSSSGSVRTYIVYCDGRQVDCTTELTSIVSGLTPCTQYTVEVCASSSKGRSERCGCQATTLDLGAHAPPKPQVTVLGRHEMTVTWEPPEQPLGRINHYNVLLNGKKVVYTGTDMSCKISPLTADTEYLVTVVVVTNEGKAESKPSKKRTAKDEFDPQRQPLWCPSRRYSQASLMPAEGTRLAAESMAPQSLSDVDSRRASLVKLEPSRAAPKPLKTELPAVRRKSLPPPPPIESKVLLKEAREASRYRVSSLAPTTTLVLDRFGDSGGGGGGGGGHLKRVTSEDARASVHVTSERVVMAAAATPMEEAESATSTATSAPASASASASVTAAAAAAASVAAVASAAAPTLSGLMLQAPARSNARSELEPLTSVRDGGKEARQQQQQQPQQQHQQQRRQRPRQPNRKSKESLWLQSRSLTEVDQSNWSSCLTIVGVSKLAAGDPVDFDDQQDNNGALLSLNARSSTDRFKTNLAILNSKPYNALGLGQQQQPNDRHQLQQEWQREATLQPTAANSRFNRHGTLVRLDRMNRERTVMHTKSMEFPLRRQTQQLD